MNEFHIRIHYYGHDDEEDDFVKFVAPVWVTSEKLRNTIDEVQSRYKSYGGYSDTLEMTDDIMHTMAEMLSGVWTYAPVDATIVIGENW